MAQEFDGRGHVSGFNLLTDVSGGDPAAIHHLLFHNGAGQIFPAAEFGQQFVISLARVAEAEIIAADKAHRIMVPDEHFQEILPGHAPDLPVKGQGQHPVHVEMFCQNPFPLFRCGQQGRGLALNQGIRVITKGHHTSFAATGFRQRPAGTQQRLMAQMNTVKKTQGVDRFFFHTCIVQIGICF